MRKDSPEIPPSPLPPFPRRSVKFAGFRPEIQGEY